VAQLEPSPATFGGLVRLAIEGLALSRRYDSPRHRVQRMHDRLSATPHRDNPSLSDLDDALHAS